MCVGGERKTNLEGGREGICDGVTEDARKERQKNIECLLEREAGRRMTAAGALPQRRESDAIHSSCAGVVPALGRQGAGKCRH